MEKIIFDQILTVIDQNPMMGISYKEINEKFGMSSQEFMDIAKSESWLYRLKPRITKDCIFFRKRN